jgi:hypothetical protein
MIVNLKAGKCKSKFIPPERRMESATTTGRSFDGDHVSNIVLFGIKFTGTGYLFPGSRKYRSGTVFSPPLGGWGVTPQPV